MTAYVDSSALLRVVLRERGALEQLRKCEALVSSELLGVESRRTIDRLRVTGALDADDAALRLQLVDEWLEAVDLVPMQGAVIRRAGEPLPVPLGTLDAIHLATALVWSDRAGTVDVFATHDLPLAQAARAFGFRVLGA